MPDDDGKAKTSMNLDRDLYRRLRVFAAEHDRKVGDVFEQAVREYLDRNQKGQMPIDTDPSARSLTSRLREVE